jgi:hypothetical protein
VESDVTAFDEIGVRNIADRQYRRWRAPPNHARNRQPRRDSAIQRKVIERFVFEGFDSPVDEEIAGRITGIASKRGA